MAIYQYNLYFVPRITLLREYQLIPEKLATDYLNIPWWLDTITDVKNLLTIIQFFGPIQAWTESHNDLRRFGDENTNDICIMFDHETNKVQELSCRIDLREPDKNFIHRAINLAIEFDCMLMDVTGTLYEPTIDNFLHYMELSNAWKFVSNPQEYIEAIAKKHPEHN